MSSRQVGKNLFCGALLLGLAAIQTAYAVPVLSLTATPSPAVQGSSVALDVVITDVVDLYAYQFSLAFNPAVLQATSATEGSFLATGGSTFFGAGAIDNTLGSISFAFDSLIGSVPGVSGTGILERINFNVVNAGSSTLTFSDVLFLDSVSSAITVQIENRTLLAVSAIPEPATVALMAAGFAGLAAWSRRRRAAA